MYNKIDNSKNNVAREKEIAKFWNDKDIIQKNFDLNEDGEYFTFYDGPPTANGKPHVGHVLTRVMKDLIPRYKVMKGRSEEHTSELQSRQYLVCRLLLEKKHT